jgi:2-oxoglutarate dehydrogenase E2 component (dihydrolipoamide succinyltransferase)
MPVQVIMPQFGESVVEGTITQWLKKPGDPVERYEALVEVNTDKVDTEVPSPASGVLLEILVPEGTTATAGTLLAVISGEAEPNQATMPANQGQAVLQPAHLQEATIPESSRPAEAAIPCGRHPELGFISPVVARMALSEGIDLHQVNGTGLEGRITRQDLERHLGQPGQRAPEPFKITAPSIPTTAAPALVELGDEILPLTPVRRRIAEHMVFSERTSPHVTTVMEADLSRIVAHRSANKAGFQKDGVNLTFTAYFIAASAAALKAFPVVNSSWSEEGLIVHKGAHVGMATSLSEEGLIVPVIKHADRLSLLGIAQAVNNLAQRARAHQLTPDEVRGGTFTITNHGISGSLFAAPIINQPQCAILGVGAIQKRVVVVSEGGQDAIAIRPMVYLSLTFDHRILDGAIADHFLAKVVDILQNWA